MRGKNKFIRKTSWILVLILFAVLVVACDSPQVGPDTGQNSNNRSGDNGAEEQVDEGIGPSTNTSGRPVVMEFTADW